MKITCVALGLLSFTVLSTKVLAQTCGSPLPILTGQVGIPLTGDLCTAFNSLATYGSIPSPQNEVIYSFAAVAASGTFTMAPNPFGGLMVLMPSPCSDATEIIAAGSAGSPMPVTGLVTGANYYLIVTAEPDGPADACGPYSITRAGFPVALQSFSVE